MFVAVVATAAALRPPMGEFLRGLLVPAIPPGGVSWTVALVGGIGGTVTVLCYGYWIREEKRQGIDQLRVCRVDLATAYAMTAVFGLGMVVIGASLGPIEGGGATLMVRIASRLQDTLGAAGPVAKWLFLAGAWAAVFSSMLGVWQSTPYLFADLWRLVHGQCTPLAPREGNQLAERDGITRKHLAEREEYTAWRTVDTQSLPYRAYLYAIAVLPILGLAAVEFRSVQKWYAVVGALFIPMLAGVLLYLNGSSRWVGARSRNSRMTTAVLVGALVLFAAAGVLEIRDSLLPRE
jgi:Mn2+/Fe2+ NRAMP family transporter